jgi:hypothetical protein
MPRVWLITGSSRGLGRAFAEAALASGCQVAATARNAEDLVELKDKYGDLVLQHPPQHPEGLKSSGLRAFGPIPSFWLVIRSKPVPNNGRGQEFESPRAYHIFNNLQRRSWP